MSKATIKVNFNYGDKTFNKLIEKIIDEKLFYYSFSEENINKTCYSKDNRTTAIYQEQVKKR